MKPLFVPLRRVHFERFRDGSKRIEWRAYGPRWNRRVAHRGRKIILSSGYSGARLAGEVVRTRKVAAQLAPQEARDIYPGKRFLCAIHVCLESDGIPRNERASRTSDIAAPQ